MRTFEYNSISGTDDGQDVLGVEPCRDVAAFDTQAPCYGTRSDRRFFARAYAVMTACYALMMAAYTVVFWHSSDAVFNLGVCFAYAAMYFGIPILVARMAFQRDLRFRPTATDTRGMIQTGTGPVKPAVALAQIVIIPAALTLCAIALVTVFSIVTAGHQP